MRAIGMMGAVAAASLLLAGCGGDSAGTGPDDPTDDAGATTVDDGDSTGAPVDDGGDVTDEAPAVITVDGKAYPIPNFMGGQCSTESEPERGRDLAMYGYAESGERIELSFIRVSADSSESGQEEYRGQLSSIGGGTEGPWITTSLDPWPWLDGDRSRVADTVTMEDRDGGTIEVAFDITCP